MMRWQALIAIILIVVLLLTGCYTTKNIPTGEKLPKKTTTVDGVVLTSGDTVYFRDHDGTFDPMTGHILGYATDGNYRVFSKADVSYLLLRKKEPISWILAGVVIVAVVVTVVAALIVSSMFSDDDWLFAD